MNNVTRAFFALLRCGLWGREPENPEMLHLAAEDWNSIYRESRRQTVTGIVHSGLSFIPEEFLPDEGLMTKWTAAAFLIEQASRKMDAIVAGVTGKFLGLGLHPVLLKGQAAARLYREPLLRECGDIDLYFADRAEWREAVETLAKEGTALSRVADGSCHYETDGIVVELHSKMMDICNPFRQKWLKELEPQFCFDVAEIGGCRINTPSPELNMLLMSSHIMKHAFGRGVGLRQICDAALNSLRLETPGPVLRGLVKDAGLLKWNRLLDSFLVEHLGFPEDRLPYPDRRVPPDSLLKIVMEGGNFGKSVCRDKDKSLIARKMHTLGACLRHIPFALRTAPSEAIWSMLQLAAGQFGTI